MIQTLTADGDTAEYTVPSTLNHATAGRVLVSASGTWGSGTLVVKKKGPDGTFRTIADSSMTTDSDLEIAVKPGAVVKGSLSGSTSPSIVVIIE